MSRLPLGNPIVLPVRGPASRQHRALLASDTATGFKADRQRYERRAHREARTETSPPLACGGRWHGQLLRHPLNAGPAKVEPQAATAQPRPADARARQAKVSATTLTRNELVRAAR